MEVLFPNLLKMSKLFSLSKRKKNTLIQCYEVDFMVYIAQLCSNYTFTFATGLVQYYSETKKSLYMKT